MKRTGVMLVILLVWAATVLATPCNIHMIAGRYAGAASGALWVGTPDFRTIAPLMPAALVGVFTINDDGTFESTTWSGLGSQWWAKCRARRGMVLWSRDRLHGGTACATPVPHFVEAQAFEEGNDLVRSERGQRAH